MKRAASLPDQLTQSVGRSSLSGSAAALWRMLVKQQLLFAIMSCYLLLGFAASLLIPPWQSPDEPAHFEHAILVRYDTDAELSTVQQPILDSFKRFQFYRFRGYDEPKTPPKSFSDLDYLIIRQVNKTPLYYQLASAAASWTDDTTLQLYSMRWLSVLLSALSLPLAFALAREALPEARPQLALIAAALVALLPMYGYIGASVNPDNIGTPLAAATALFAVRALHRKQTLASVAAMLTLAFFSIWARRSAAALAPWAGFLAATLALRWAWSRLPKPAVIASAMLATLALILVLVWPSRLAADWYPGNGTTMSQSSVQPYEGSSVFTLNAPNAISQQVLNYQMPTLRGSDVHVQAAVRGDQAGTTGAISLSDNRGTLATLPLRPVGTWQLVAFDAHVPNDAESVYLSLQATGGSVSFDAITATHSNPDRPIVLSNPGAEDAFTWWQARALSNTFVDYTTRMLRALRTGIYVSAAALPLYSWQFEQMTSSLIGRFGWMAIAPAAWIITSVRLIAVLLLAGLGLIWRRNSGLNQRQRQALLWLGLLVIFCVVTLLLEYIPNLSFAAFPQGRYLFPCLAPLAALLVSGLAQWLPPRFDRVGIIACIGVLLALNLWCWFALIVPYFYA